MMLDDDGVALDVRALWPPCEETRKATPIREGGREGERERGRKREGRKHRDDDA